MYLALGILFLLFSISLAAIVILTVMRSVKDSSELISKKNLLYLVPTFLIIYLLHITASAFNGEDIDFFYCFSLIYTTLDVLKFKAVKTLLLPICQAYPIYYVDFVVAFIVGGATVILSIASFFGQRIRNYFSVKKLLAKSADIVIGDSESALRYAKNTPNSLILGSNFSRSRYAELIKSGLTVVRIPFESKAVLKKFKKGEHNVVVFRDGDFSYTDVINEFALIRKSGKNIRLYLEAYQDEMKIIKEKFIACADKKVGAYIFCFSKYELLARRFVVDYPITKYIPRDFYNANCTLKSKDDKTGVGEDKDINVVFIGFGKVNYQLFRMCAMQFQFAQEKNGKLVSKPVKYHIYDNKDTMLHNEFFSRILYEFDEEFADCDFPKPEKICDVVTRPLDINSVAARKEFKALVNENSFTYFIISLDSDLEDASYAQTVKRLFSNDANYRIFVRAKNNNGERLNELSDRIIYFGDEKELYTHDNIVNDDLTELAQRINLRYNEIKNPPEWLEKLYGNKTISAEELSREFSDPKKKEYMLEKWAELPYIEQASNLYHAISLPFKLNLLGYDMVKKSGQNDCGVREDKFNEVYVNDGRNIDYADYAFFFKTQSSNVLAYLEHSRWNALYILYDYKQMKKSDIKLIEKESDGKLIKVAPHKNIQLKQHACITTYYGLDDLVNFKYNLLSGKELTKQDKCNNNELLKDLSSVYKYDYMSLDRLYREITEMGYVLVENENK